MKYNWIDFGRGIAILLVIMVHTGQEYSNSKYLKSIIERGDMGVMLFFILSSITLFNSFENRFEKDGINRNKAFFIRRIFRIAPVYYLSIIFWTLLAISSNGFSSVSYWKVIVNILFLNSIILPAIDYIPPGGWSIGTEMIFYSTVPFLFNYAKSIRKAIYLLIFSIIISNLFNYFDQYLISNFTKYNYNNLRGWYFYFWFPNQFPVFCFGIVCYNLFKSKSNFVSNLKFLFIIISITLFILLTQVSFSLSYPMYFFQAEYLYSFVFCLFIFGIRQYSFSDKISSIFLQIGKYSFSMYTLHFIFLMIGHYAFVRLKFKINFYSYYIVIVTITFIFSKWLYKFEKYYIDYGNNLITKLKLKSISVD